MKRADDTKTAIMSIKNIYNIKNDCKNIEQIIQNLHVSDKETEYLTINLMIDKYRYNKDFVIDKDSFVKCRQEVKNFLE